MSLLFIVAMAFVGGLVGALAMDARFWVGFVREMWRHGLDNHLCDDPNCCSREALTDRLIELERRR